MRRMYRAIVGLLLVLSGCANYDGNALPAPSDRPAIAMRAGSAVSVRPHHVRAIVLAEQTTLPPGMSLWFNGDEYLVVNANQIVARFDNLGAPGNNAQEPPRCVVITPARPFSRQDTLPPGISLWAGEHSYSMICNGHTLAKFDTPAPLATHDAKRTPAYSAPVLDAPETSWTYDPAISESGSYYGETSERTGLPRTIYVNGYYRRDGTYVRSYYRSP